MLVHGHEPDGSPDGLPSRMVRSSDALGWSTVRALSYADPVETDPFVSSSDSLLVVLVTSGSTASRAATGRPGGPPPTVRGRSG